ncbi:MAG: class I SAM-dependent methyltransferase [Ardenticatenaceae bacterium]|nr:class I SAM-dependent methyltransferase [Ardenticatenaceae bacterium]
MAGLYYWLFVITEGVFLGRRVVVWLYDLTAHKYDEIKQYDADAEQFFVVRPLLFQLRHMPAPLILDVATGTGRVPLFVLEWPTFNGRLVGLDPAEKMLHIAVEKLRPFGNRAMFIQQTADALPFPDNSFDAVTCLEALEFFPSETAALQEMVRVLQPEGTLLITRRRGWEAKTFVGRYRSREQYADYLTTLGLTDVEILPWQIDYDQVFAKKLGNGR